jgi:hypothetical protein
MQALRRKLKGPAKPNSSNKDRTAAETLGSAMSTIGPPAGGDDMTIAGELSATPSSKHSRRLVQGSKGSRLTPPLNRRESVQLPLGMIHILPIF